MYFSLCALSTFERHCSNRKNTAIYNSESQTFWSSFNFNISFCRWGLILTYGCPPGCELFTEKVVVFFITGSPVHWLLLRALWTCLRISWVIPSFFLGPNWGALATCLLERSDSKVTAFHEIQTLNWIMFFTHTHTCIRLYMFPARPYLLI